jgi:hypothetical protein
MMLLVYSAVLAMVVLLVLFYRQMLICIDLIEQGRVRAPKPNPILFNRDTKEFMDFVFTGKYRSSSDTSVLRSFGLLRAVISAQLLIFAVLFVYVVTVG